MTQEEKTAALIGPGKLGVEIRLHDGGIPGFEPAPIVVGVPAALGGSPVDAAVIAHPGALPFASNTLDYVAAVRVLNHVANPVAVLAEWYRVLRPGGLIYAVTGHRLATADRTRDLTGVDHLLEDYVRQTTEGDPSHIDDSVYDADWAMDHPQMPAEDVPGERAALARRLHEAVGRGEPIAIRFHTFEPSSLHALVETLCCWPQRRLNWELVDTVSPFPASDPTTFLTAIRVQKGWLDRAQADAFDVTARDDRRAALLRPSV